MYPRVTLQDLLSLTWYHGQMIGICIERAGDFGWLGLLERASPPQVRPGRVFSWTNGDKEEQQWWWLRVKFSLGSSVGEHSRDWLDCIKMLSRELEESFGEHIQKDWNDRMTSLDTLALCLSPKVWSVDQRQQHHTGTHRNAVSGHLRPLASKSARPTYNSWTRWCWRSSAPIFNWIAWYTNAEGELRDLYFQHTSQGRWMLSSGLGILIWWRWVG